MIGYDFIQQTWLSLKTLPSYLIYTCIQKLPSQKHKTKVFTFKGKIFGFNWHRLMNNLVLKIYTLFYSGENLLEKSPAHSSVNHYSKHTCKNFNHAGNWNARGAYGSLRQRPSSKKRPTNARISQTISSVALAHFLQNLISLSIQTRSQRAHAVIKRASL